MSEQRRTPRTLSSAFGGQLTSVDEQRAIWQEALHEHAVWEGPMFAKPVSFVGRAAVGAFMEFLLSVVPRFSTQLIAAYPTPDPDTLITMKDGQAFRMRESCNPFQTYSAFGKQRWETHTDAIMAEHNVAWPAAQPRDGAALPSR